MRKLLLSIFTAVMFVSTAAAAEWNIDTAHTNSYFSIIHLGIADVHGMFPGVTGVLKIDDRDIAKSSVSVKIDVASLDTGVEQRDSHLKSADFFELAKFPEMRFTSKKVVKNGEGRLSVTGDLTIHGVTKEVVLDVDGPSAVITDPWGHSRRGLKAHTVIDRYDFGITWNNDLPGGGLMVGREVNITIDLEMVAK